MPNYGFSYASIMEDALIDAEERVRLPTDKSWEQMKSEIADITAALRMGGLSDSDRIILTAQRHEMRCRMNLTEQVAARLLGITNGK